MSHYPLHQATPGFHGDKCRLLYGESGSSAYFELTREVGRPSTTVATVYLPAEQRPRLRAACLAFNQIMDGATEQPFSTYPEDRAKMLALCAKVEGDSYSPEAAVTLADLVRAILEDEIVGETVTDDPEPDSDRTLGLLNPMTAPRRVGY